MNSHYGFGLGHGLGKHITILFIYDKDPNLNYRAVRIPGKKDGHSAASGPESPGVPGYPWQLVRAESVIIPSSVRASSWILTFTTAIVPAARWY